MYWRFSCQTLSVIKCNVRYAYVFENNFSDKVLTNYILWTYWVRIYFCLRQLDKCINMNTIMTEHSCLPWPNYKCTCVLAWSCVCTPTPYYMVNEYRANMSVWMLLVFKQTYPNNCCLKKVICDYRCVSRCQTR